MNDSQHIKSCLKMAAAGLLLMGTSSCASLFGNPNCHCTHPGACVCCDQPQALRVVGHQPVQKDSIDKSFLQELLNKDYSLKQYLPEEPQRMTWVDDSIAETQDELMQYLKVSSGWVMPRSVTTDNTENAIFFYFTERPDGTPDQLRIRVQYYADDPLRFQQLHFIIDGFDYYFKPSNFNRGKGKGVMIWENSDDPLTEDDKDLAYALAHCQWTQLKLIGSDGMMHNKMMSDSQLKDFYRVLQLYRLKGGEF